MISGATRPKSYHLQLKFPFNYCISQCKCPNNANVGSEIQVISFFVNRSICRLDNRSFFNRYSCLLRASEWCFHKTPNVQSWSKNDMILGATRPKSYYLQLNFSSHYCISQCKCLKMQILTPKCKWFFLDRFICKLDDEYFFKRHSCLLRASEWCFCKTPNVQSWFKNDMILGATRPKSYFST